MFSAERHETAEPAGNVFPYAGWVPTANGHLSFRHIGEARHPTEAIYANVATQNGRLILAYQRRSLSDALFQPIVHYFCNIEGSFWFALAARSTGVPGAIEAITGKIYIFKSRRDWKTKAEKDVRKNIYEINNSQLSLLVERDQILEDSFGRAENCLNTSSDIEVAFHLNRSGECYFSSPHFRDKNLQYASLNYASIYNHDIPRWISDQSYFFLRDLSHNHQHHSPFSDTILMLQERKFGRTVWRRNIVFSLHHYIIRTRRFADVKSLFQAAGVHAYCRSFQAICERSLGPLPNGIPEFNDEALLQSLNARWQEEIAQANEGATDQIIKLTKAVGNCSFALLLSTIFVILLVMLVQPLIDPNKTTLLKSAGEFAFSHIVTLIFLIFLFLAIVWVVTHREWQSRSVIVRDLLEISNVRRKYFITTYIVFAFVIALASVSFSKLALFQISYFILGVWRLISQ